MFAGNVTFIVVNESSTCVISTTMTTAESGVSDKE